MRIDPAFGLVWVSVSGEPARYKSDGIGAYALRGDVEELQERAARLWRTVDLMRRADDIETARAIAEVAVGPR